MLNACRVFIKFNQIAIKQSFSMVCKKPMVSFITILVIALTMMLPVLLWLVTHNLQHLVLGGQHIGPMDVFIEQNASKQDQVILLERIRHTVSVSQATLITPEEGLDDLQKQAGFTDLLQYLPDNPLPAVIHVIPAVDVLTAQALQHLHDRFMTYEHVEMINFDLQWLQRMESTLRFIMTIIHSIMILLAVIVIIIIANMLHVVMAERRDEIMVLNLIGASRAYIMRPHVYAGIWYGLCSALLACILVDAFLLCLQRLMNVWQISDFFKPIFSLLPLQSSWVLLCSAMFLGWLGSKILIYRQLMLESR